MNVAVIGCGGMGTMHAHIVRTIGLNVVVCADTAAAKAEALATTFGADATPNGIEAAARKDVDIVAVCTSTPNHFPFVAAAAQARKNIFCEKPFCRTIAECKEAIAAAKKAKIKLFVGHVVRYFQEFEAIREKVQAGVIGKPGFVKTYRGGIFPLGEKAWFHDYAQSGGVTMDTIIHDFDWIRYVFGEPDRVFCQAIQRSEPEKLDYSLATFRMKNGIIANVVGTWAHPGGFRVRAEVCGEKGMVSFDSNEAPISTMMRAKPGEGATMIVPESPVDVSPYELEWRDFIGWIEGKNTPRVTPEDGMAAVKMALGALESAKTGKVVKL